MFNGRVHLKGSTVMIRIIVNVSTSVQFITVRYICNYFLLFAHWFPVLQYNVNDSQFVFYKNGPASSRGAREELRGAKPPFAPLRSAYGYSTLLTIDLTAAIRANSTTLYMVFPTRSTHGSSQGWVPGVQELQLDF